MDSTFIPVTVPRQLGVNMRLVVRDIVQDNIDVFDNNGDCDLLGSNAKGLLELTKDKYGHSTNQKCVTGTNT